MPSVPVSIELLPFPSFKITYDTVFVKVRPPSDDHLVVISMYATVNAAIQIQMTLFVGRKLSMCALQNTERRIKAVFTAEIADFYLQVCLTPCPLFRANLQG